MAQPYVGEIRMFAGNFAPAGWMFCEGQQLPISENETLYQIIGTTYGGDGQESFNLPNLGGRFPIHNGVGPNGTNYQNGETAGVESVTLTTQQIPVHNHAWIASSAGGAQNTPQNNVTAAPPVMKLYRPTTPDTALPVNTIGPTGGSQPHENRMPFIAINYIISLFGIYPSQT